MSYQNAALFHFLGKKRARYVIVSREYEIRRRLDYFKSHFTKLCRNVLACFDDFLSVVIVIFAVSECRFACNQGQTVDAVRISRKFKLVKVGYNLFICKSKSKTRARKASRLGISADNKQIFVAIEQFQCALAAKINVCFINKHHAVGICLKYALGLKIPVGALGFAITISLPFSSR